MNRREMKLVAWYQRMLNSVGPEGENFADDSAVYPDSAARILVMMRLVPYHTISHVARRISCARALCDKWGARVHQRQEVCTKDQGCVTFLGPVTVMCGRTKLRQVLVTCAHCETEQTLLFTDTRPEIVTCAKCQREFTLYRCFVCGYEHAEGDQGFITLDIPYGSIHDTGMTGPVYACSAKCVREAFAKDDFDARNTFAKGE